MTTPEKNAPLRFTSFDQSCFPYRYWGSLKTASTVIIGIHGICGASDDFSGLASYLTKKSDQLVFYAYEVRGQGRDPQTKRRGDIRQANEWLSDLEEFTKQIKETHPESRILWCGESMGSLIASHYSLNNKKATAHSDGLILLSPVVRIGDQAPVWKIRIARCCAFLFPWIRVPLSRLLGNNNSQVTADGIDHDKQSATNDWHVDSFTLRLLGTLATMVETMPQAARCIDRPTLILSGGKDIFTPAHYTTEWLINFPSPKTLSHRHFAHAYHLLMYDNCRLEVFEQIHLWIKQLKS